MLRIAPTMRSGAERPDDRWREVQGLTAFSRPFVSLGPAVVGLETAHLLAMTAGLLVAPVAAGAALATWCAQPALVFGGGAGRESRNGLHPRDLWWRTGLRLPLAWRDNLRTVVHGIRQAAPAVPPTSRTAPMQVDELFAARRNTCPWCGSDALADRIDASNLMQPEPKTFHLDECTVCGHVFQNPALSDSGLAYYYGTVYDDNGESESETEDAMGAFQGTLYRRRAEAVGQVTAARLRHLGPDGISSCYRVVARKASQASVSNRANG